MTEDNEAPDEPKVEDEAQPDGAEAADASVEGDAGLDAEEEAALAAAEAEHGADADADGDADADADPSREEEALEGDDGEDLGGPLRAVEGEGSADPAPPQETGAVEAAEGAEGAEDSEGAEDGGEPPPGAAPFVLEDWVYAAVEAMAFSSAEPLTPRRAKEILVAELRLMAVEMGGEPGPLPTIQDVKKVFKLLGQRWSDPSRSVGNGFRLMELDGGLTYRTAASSARYVRRVQTERPPRLSRAALETLAVVAYRQPATKPQVEEVRGVDSGGALKALLDKKLIRVIGKADEIGRPLLYGTTRTFLEFFQLSSLSELPTLKELHELDNGPPEAVPEEQNVQPAVVMDLFNPNGGDLVSEETERESADALDALEQALTEAKDVAKKASTVVWGVQVEDDEPKAPVVEAAAAAPTQPEPAVTADEDKITSES